MSLFSQANSFIKEVKAELSDIYHDTAAEATDVGVATVVGGGIAIGVGAMIYARISPKIVGTDNVSNESIASLNTTVWDSFGLLPMVLFLTVAGLLIGVVYWFTGSRNSA